jgi:hypothetical protein
VPSTYGPQPPLTQNSHQDVAILEAETAALTVGIAVDDIEGSYEVSDDGDTRAFGNCDGDRGAGRGLRDFCSHFD